MTKPLLFLRVALDILRAPSAKAFLDLKDVSELIAEAREVSSIGQDGPSDISDDRMVAMLREADAIFPLAGDLEVNGMRAAQPYEAVSVLAPGAVVSLQSVLGDAGVAQGPSAIIFAVVDPSRSAPEAVEVERYGRFRFVPMPQRVIDTGAVEDRLARGSVPKATPERALCDWFWLAANGGQKRPLPPLEFDIDDLDMERVKRLADALDVRQALENWLVRKADHDADPDVRDGMSHRLGF